MCGFREENPSLKKKSKQLERRAGAESEAKSSIKIKSWHKLLQTKYQAHLQMVRLSKLIMV
jgi:hypothetical protein